VIEFLDELVYGVREAAWPLIRSDLGLSYAQIGILLGLPAIVSGFIEPVLGLLGDLWKWNPHNMNVIWPVGHWLAR
jgi:FSR family fosmidomycin resistance protein-like MFS transporter